MRYYFGILSISKQRRFSFQILFYRFENYMNRSHKNLFINFFIPRSAYMFVLITHETSLYTKFYVIVFPFLLPCNTINLIASRKC